MADTKVLDILKNAILLETRGRAFYLKAAEQTGSAAVRDFFTLMADEEKTHVQILSDQYKSYRDHRKFLTDAASATPVQDAVSDVLARELKEKIASAGFESAAISAAIAMEERAVRFYGTRAEETGDADEAGLYRWLSEWEQGHLNMLLEMDKALTEKIWGDNQFWPF